MLAMLVWLLPALFALGLVGVVVASAVDRRAELLLTRVAVAVFGEYVATREEKRDQQRRMRAAHVAETHRVFASRTLLYAAIGGVSGGILGVYLIAGLLAALEITGELVRSALPPALGFLAGLTRLSELGPGDLFPLLFLSSATFGAGASLIVYYGRWLLLDQRAYARGGKIEATLPRTVAFVFALSRSGMAFPKVMNTLAENEKVYGEAAEELGVAVREMETLGADPLTALDNLANRTPADNMNEFAGNLSSVLGSGRSLSNFLRGQYERFQEEAESQQEQYLEILSTMAEAYVTVLVAGPLFFITILVVIGLVLGSNTLIILQVIVYLGIPLATFGFAVYVDSISQADGSTEQGGDEFVDPRVAAASAIAVPQADEGSSESGGQGGSGMSEPASEPTGVTDGGTDEPEATAATATAGTAATEAATTGAATAETATTGAATAGGGDQWADVRARLEAYDTFAALVSKLGRPTTVMRERPVTTLYVTLPIALLWLTARIAAVPADLVAAVRTIDGPVIEATLFVLVGYGVAYEIDKRRTRRIEKVVPDFLDRMASVNDAGVSIVESIRTLSQDDLGALTPHLKQTWQDMQWGADAETALHRLSNRIDSPMISRSVTLVTNAMSASGDVAPVLEIAADEARATQTLRRERRQVMITYLIVIYVSFVVFLAIVVALTEAFVPAIEQAELGSALPSGGGGVGGVGGGALSGIQNVQPGKYILLFYHASAIQALASGTIAGQLGEGDVRDGIKHAAIMLLVTYVAFTIIGA